MNIEILTSNKEPPAIWQGTDGFNNPIYHLLKEGLILEP